MNLTLPALWESSEFSRGSTFGGSAADRVANATLIVREFLRARYPIGIALAAVVNARAESDLSNQAIGDNGHSVGLFQLSDLGAGRGMSVAERKDPRVNVRTIIRETKTYGARLMQAYRSGASVAELSVIFGEDIERHAPGAAPRDQLARQMFPGIANVPAKHLILLGAVIPLVAGSLLALTGLVLLVYVLRK